MKQIIKNIAFVGLVATGAGGILTSCEDFLTITPSSSIVEEEFWQDKNDLNNAVMACYKRMVSDELLRFYVYSGEQRSDNVERSTTLSATGQAANIMNANLLPTYNLFDWKSIYNVINCCNKVLAHGPEVVQMDESFSENDWKPIHAEAITLRALCHFYLVRTYGEVPYITVDYNNDSQELRSVQSTQLAVLDSIVADLESIKGDAMVDYGNTVANKGRITRKAVYALLADAYLWRASYKAGNNQPFSKVTLASNYNGPWTEAELTSRHEDYGTTAESDYQKCIEYCDLIIDMVTQEKLEYIDKYGIYIGGSDFDIELEDLLESNEPSSSRLIPSSTMAYNAIFGMGNSDESIFELQVDGTKYSNTMITSLYYDIKSGKAGWYTGPEAIFGGVITTPNTTSDGYIFTKTDYRRWESILFDKVGQNTFEISKYINQTISQHGPTNPQYLADNASSALGKTSIVQTKRSSSNVDANWIFYRLSEIFLMKAEAMSQLYDDEEHLAEAFTYVRSVFKRSNPIAYLAINPSQTKENDSLKFEVFSTPENLEKLVLKERQREFVGEGKRWFDLVRYALRRGNTAEMLDILCVKYTNGKSIKAKLADMQSLFSPVYNNEIKNNSWLYQNGVWFVNETSSRTDDL